MSNPNKQEVPPAFDKILLDVDAIRWLGPSNMDVRLRISVGDKRPGDSQFVRIWWYQDEVFHGIKQTHHGLVNSDQCKIYKPGPWEGVLSQLAERARQQKAIQDTALTDLSEETQAVWEHITTCQLCGQQKTHYRLGGYQCNVTGHDEAVRNIEADAIRRALRQGRDVNELIEEGIQAKRREMGYIE
jgi:hypothetical protein